MAELLATELETAVADTGLLLLELEKLRPSGDATVARSRSNALALGDRARSLHRARGLDDAAAEPLLREARALIERLRDLLQNIRASAPYRAAVAAHRDHDHAALATRLPGVLLGLEPIPQPPALFHPVVWLRRNRPRSPADIAAELARLRETGVAAEGDAAARGTDPELPAVALLGELPASDPLAMRFDPEGLPAAVFRLRDTGEYLVHVPVLRAPFDVVVPETLDPDEVGEISVDHPRYRAQLVEALERVALPVRSA